MGPNQFCKYRAITEFIGVKSPQLSHLVSAIYMDVIMVINVITPFIRIGSKRPPCTGNNVTTNRGQKKTPHKSVSEEGFCLPSFCQC